MGSDENVFHVAIPCLDLAAAAAFYGDALGCRVARRYEDRITLDFFGAQVVCHLCGPESIDAAPKMYPRHFGLTIGKEADFTALLEKIKRKPLLFFAPPFSRFKGRPEEHRAFFLKDPSNNLIEFKWYRDPAMRF